MNWIAFEWKITSTCYSKHPIQVGVESLNPCRWKTHISNNMCSPSGETHIPSDMCFPTLETDITSDMCSPTPETSITSDMCSPT